ncbi:sensor domain-containing diguanylate cyclase [Jeotgalibacillus proteolyticus]|uniref:Sensor domain-containing diguanylate cyclase n=2 Tax=Jeotgalibacillus proteolyticus TaxID=2082395 RepID=A0A2S5G8L7_9BACL|nr:sensor domain-containing diguanylate cyclase [Jeotgalibacillus proteolyticus]
MVNEWLIYMLVIILAGTLSLFLCLYVQIKIKDGPGVKPYIYMTLFSTIFIFSYAFELSSSELEQILFWVRIQYLFMPFIPAFILLMCVEYAGHKIKPWITYCLFILPITTIFMHNTNNLHQLYYTSAELRSDAPFPVLSLQYGPWFYVHSIFVLLCVVMGVIILIMKMRRSLFRFRMQLLTMTVGLLMPILGNYFYLNDLSPHGIDLGPVSMSASFLLHAAAIISFQMFNVGPIARDTVFESMKDGVMVLNQNEVIVDFNRAMGDVLSSLSQQVIGKPIKKVLRNHPELFNMIEQEAEGDIQLVVGVKKSYFHIRFTPVWNKTELLGKIITFVDVSERVHIQQRLEQLASTDGLTNLFNRTSFITQAEAAFSAADQNHDAISVIMFDIDYFKAVNDTYGHGAGDAVLTTTAKTAKNTLRPGDVIGRYGGEEFVICLPHTSQEEARDLAEKIRITIADSIIHLDGNSINVTSSFGVSSALLREGDHSHSLHSLMKEADMALYEAKRNGRNYVQAYSEAVEMM